MKQYAVKKIITSYGRGYGSAHFDREEYAVVLKPFDIILRSFKTEAEAENYKKEKEQNR